MGALCCCYLMRHSPPAAENSNNSRGCIGPCCLFGNLFTKLGTLEAQDAVTVAPSSTGHAAAAASSSPSTTTTSAVSANSSVATRSQASQANRDRVRNPSPQQPCQMMVSAPLPLPAPVKSLPVTAHQKSMGSGENDGADAAMEEKKLAQMNGEFNYHHLLSEECPTCLEGYDSENPKIVTKCSHHFHLSCIYDWQERSDNCPICSRVMAFEESD